MLRRNLYTVVALRRYCIGARAIRRGGELLKQNPGTNRGRPRKNIQEGNLPNLSKVEHVQSKEAFILIVTRHRDQTIRIGSDIIIKIMQVRGTEVIVGIEAPKEVPVHRGELYDRINKVPPDSPTV